MNTPSYTVSLDNVQEMVRLKYELDQLVTGVMMSKCIRVCNHKECPLDAKEGEQTSPNNERLAIALLNKLSLWHDGAYPGFTDMVDRIVNEWRSATAAIS